MRRIERLLGEARHLRIRRATRVRLAKEDSSAFWLDEMRVAQRVVSDLMEAHDPAGASAPDANGGDGRRRAGPVSAISPGALVELIDVFQTAFEAACPPARRQALFETLHLKVTEQLNPSGLERLRAEFAGGEEASGRPFDRARRAAVQDASHLVVEVAAFEAFRRWCEESDGGRAVSSYVDASLIELRGDRIGKRRPDRPARKTKGQLNAERSFSRFWKGKNGAGAPAGSEETDGRGTEAAGGDAS